jgi:hypothetical protein
MDIGESIVKRAENLRASRGSLKPRCARARSMETGRISITFMLLFMSICCNNLIWVRFYVIILHIVHRNHDIYGGMDQVSRSRPGC